MELEDIVSKYPPKQIMLIPIVIIVLALISLGVTYLNTGSPVKLGVEFTGGTLVTVPATESEDAVAAEYAKYPLERVMAKIYHAKANPVLLKNRDWKPAFHQQKFWFQFFRPHAQTGHPLLQPSGCLVTCLKPQKYRHWNLRW